MQWQKIILYSIWLWIASFTIAYANSTQPESPAAVTKPVTQSAALETQAHEYLNQDPPDWDAARTAFLEAAEHDSSAAMGYLGWMHEEGLGVEPDMREAVRWYRRAAETGEAHYALKLGWMYLGGQGIDRDRTQAEHWFTQAIAAEHVPAFVAWASVLIADAQGGQNLKRIPEARDLLEQALAAGQPLATYFLARLYIEGIGEHPVDDDAAAYYTWLGADYGYPQMQGWLALMFLEGRGLPQDSILAAKWANLAAAEGDRLGNEIRLQLEEELDTEAIQQARQLAIDWALLER